MIVGLGTVLTCHASTMTYQQQSSNSSASATFTLLGNGNLQVTLANTSIGAASSASDVLTAFFFSVSPGVTLTPVSVLLGNGSSILNCLTCSGATNLGGEWGYAANVQGFANQAVHLVGAASHGVLDVSNLFGGPNLAGTNGPGGIDFGLVSYSTTPGAAAFTGSPLVHNQVIMTFGTQAPFNLSAIGTVGFLYGYGGDGSSSYSASFDTPEPASCLLIGAGLLGLYMRRRRVLP